ncbi:sulfurtransferase [Neobacillus notoginsengisoli]|uniref:Sulfurtransferase n=1 Tax=Neobacillus notoginsengisoli TaxID=1578198 RepID=A0A417YR93_9BACI|nr:sulfurtransferase [Neobacillus notoginsengisoli]RHW37371.1 sulfurtransferase [Neobacillus notoginsengisoli]
MKYIVDKEYLLKHVNEEKLRIVDCRFSLADPHKGRNEYDQAHIQGAVYFDLEKDLSGPVVTHGGRHPLPDLNELIAKLERAGIDEQTTVVAYDNGESAFAARFWWLLTYLGHQKVHVLNGGYKEWTDANYPTSSDLPVFEKTEFRAEVDSSILAEMDEVKEISLGKNKNAVLIDSREEKRYVGFEEPIDVKKGHIPGAINKPWMEGLQEGSFKPIDEQKKRFSDIDSDKEVIVYCGSGVTAIPNFLALKESGFEDVKLYLGSFSDWISYEDNEIE